MRKILSFPKRLVFAIQHGYRWYKVDISCQERKFEKALAILQKMTRRHPARVKLSLKKAQVLYALSRYQASLTELDAIVPVLETGGKLSDAEKQYCFAYLYWLALCIKVKTGADQKRMLAQLRDVNIRAIDLAKVPRVWRSNFPLRLHPNWEEP
ncbi:tetratricopeptide repeat protein [Denitrobaculum tricleocarpae]|uniref:Tetratricopeptide repeat protein n=1 Tax=Denitrobaculum tricleocarpae TaxID=2591009 RepID=A0A545TER3_9PROT|nr:tetratricopeptide repeat protein [Denitrobaculum tricleocarpae]TQV75661.1 tetratricopeptide repeat protein [Denitrobaculum tricleocarpae]